MRRPPIGSKPPGRIAVQIEEGEAFQNSAFLADTASTQLLERLEEEIKDPKAVAAGSLAALARYHRQTFGAVTERALLEIMLPAIAMAVQQACRARPKDS